MSVPRRFSARRGPVAEFGHRVRWRGVALVVYIAILLGLGVVALVPVFSPPPLVAGLPDDPDVRSAASLVHARFSVDARGLRFRSALLGDNAAGPPFSAADEAGRARAAALLVRAGRRWPGDPRIIASSAGLDLARGDLARAERQYRAAVDRGARYGEPHLGLGVTLALLSAREGDAGLRRGLELQAIAQFAEVAERDSAYEAALYDRALLLARVGRASEAARLARAYRSRDPGGAWAERLSREIEASAR